MAIEINIKKNLGTFQLDMEFRSESRRIGILGASGCGKSLTLKCIAGIETPDVGSIRMNDRALYDSEYGENLSPQKRRVGYLFQNYALFPSMTVEKNIGIGLRCGKVEKQEKVAEIMKRFHLEGMEQRLPSELSGGQQQRVALARILIYEPDVILLDEPFSALDVYLKDQMQRECMEILKDYPGTVILVSHSRDEIYRFSEETIVIDDGEVVIQKPTKELFRFPEKVKAARLTGCKNIVGVKWFHGKCCISDWGMEMDVPKDLHAEEIGAVGIRAHEFELERPKEEPYLTFPVLSPRITEDMFEYTICFSASKDSRERIDWKISKYQWNLEENEIPDEIYLREKNLLWLG